MGITDQDNKDGPQLLSSVNPTFTWVRLAQRIPVRVHITHVPPGVLISAGMTCTVVIKEGAGPEIGRGLKKIMTAIFGTPFELASRLRNHQASDCPKMRFYQRRRFSQWALIDVTALHRAHARSLLMV
jgi:hypothetical protein